MFAEWNEGPLASGRRIKGLYEMPNDTLDRFTRRARQSLTLAQEEAQRLHHNYIGTEHLLVGLIRVDNSVASKILRSLGVTARRVQELVEQTVG